jgi:WD40 repeat protein
MRNNVIAAMLMACAGTALVGGCAHGDASEAPAVAGRQVCAPPPVVVEVRRFTAGRPRVGTAAVSATGDRLAISDHRGRINVWCLDDAPRLIATTDATHDRTVAALLFSDDGQTLYIASSRFCRDGRVDSWSIDRDRVTCVGATGVDVPAFIVANADGTLATVTGESAWALPAERTPADPDAWPDVCVRLRRNVAADLPVVVATHQGTFATPVAVSADLAWAVVQTDVTRGVTDLYALREPTGSPVASLASGPNVVAFAPDASAVAMSTNGELRLFEVPAGRLRWAAPTKTIARAAFHPSGRWLLTAAMDGTLRWWHAETGVEQPAFEAGRRPPRVMEWAADGATLVLVADDGTVTILRTDAATQPVPAGRAGEPHRGRILGRHTHRSGAKS